MPRIAGSCLCGAISYSSEAAPQMTAVCHCTHCQKQAGSAFSVIVGIEASSLSFVGEQHFGEFLDTGDSGGRVRRRFCRNCGSPILSLVESLPGVAFIKAGTLEDRSWLQPAMHVWCDSAQPWFRIPEDTVKFETNPAV